MSPTTDAPGPRDAATSARLARQAQRETRPELALRRMLHGAGLRYRVHYPALGGRRTVDIAFPGARLAVDVRGCFWHACPEHGTLPRTNREWWRSKLARNVERDAQTAGQLADAGWHLVVVWEHEAVEDVAARIVSEVHKRRGVSAAPRQSATAPAFQP